MKTRNVKPQKWWASLSDGEQRLICSAVGLLRGGKPSQIRMLKPAAGPALPSAHVAATGKAGNGGRTPRFVFRWTGKLWEVVCGGGRPFHLANTLGARYFDHLLHRPNEPILAFDLEVVITPEKGEARFVTSIQPRIDARARREYKRELRQLQADRERAQKARDRKAVHDLDGQIEKVESALKAGSGTADTGERARGNVRKAIKVVVDGLLDRGEEERAFARHILETVSLGYRCCYTQPQGKIWG